MLIQNGVVHTMEGFVIENGFVAARDGKITAVGPMSALPVGADGPVIDAAGGHIVPGFVDAHCHLGMFGNGLGFEADDGNESTDPCTPHLRAIDAVNPLDRYFQEAREGGVTTVLTGPGSANPIAGQFAALKTDGRWVDEMILRAPVSMKFALGENPKSVYNERKEAPVTRMATAAIIRENLSKALEYMDKQSKAENDPDMDMPDFDAKLEALVGVLRGELPVHCHAHRADDIATAVRICREFGLRLVVVHGTEGHLISELLARENIPVITGPCLTDRCKPELMNQTIENPALLSRAGVKVAICTDHPETPIQYLPLCAAIAVRAGMDEEEALAAITINPAVIAGLEKRVGSLAVGKDADVVVTSRHPLDWKSRVEAVFIGGKQVK
ncbi:amidohydrolase [Lawsonibacter faecis]|uniref:Amidohydrolase n=1 Tax=Lawsonibacter faecis TaxID=2763052 RepID=A0A8J6MD07_9FIRM|nr:MULTISPECIES: amidohydrolase [Oscillospiraceae]MTQ96980.1 amidohydrolase family protein [Pseudoflavonifractor sp. BIOML-A16]MTR06198.1 amidohydrolase family protein [Pseudoflavonifractor sp. BIOML-A15]MTR32782.1 amidohydrolase family protein [Pseudoflavonifractor sp. BIOML-A14]MTR72890.1 amidohydrolase family protein [Pseudoflavonifractor sp. BIOML-A18]MTS63209.1 amidohydrolase family protein [Pseudoflavonifractor sp. BIOML-A5]MTS70982.1 amidohydrolase family protein [Pseudoflavonifractor 